MSPAHPTPSRVQSLVRLLWPLLALLLLHYVMAHYRLDRQDPDKDELTTSQVLRMGSARAVIDNRLQTGHPPLYFLTERVWVRLVGHSYTGMVWLSIWLGLAALPLMVLAGRELGLGGWAWAAAALLCVHPTFVYFSRYSRPWAGVILLTAAILWLGLRALRRPSVPVLFGLAVAGIVGAAWSHSLAMIWLAVLIAVLAQDELRRRAGLNFWIALVIALAAHAFFIAACMSRAGGAKPLEWIPPLAGRDYLEVTLDLLGGRTLDLRRVNWQWLFPLACLAAWAAAMVILFIPARGAAAPKKDKSPGGATDADRTPAWRLAALRLVALASILPWAVMALASEAGRPLLVYRYTVLILPGLMLIVTWAARRLPHPPLGLAVWLAILLLGGMSARWQSRERPNGLRSCIGALERQYRPDGGDIVLVFNESAKESLQLLSRRAFNVALVQRNWPPARGWQVFADKTKHARRMWVLGIWNKGGIMDTPEWASRSGKRIYEYRNKSVAVWGYQLR